MKNHGFTENLTKSLDNVLCHMRKNFGYLNFDMLSDEKSDFT